MPPVKKKKASKPKRVPHANETPLKDKQPGHGAVEREKNNMWTPSSSSSQPSTSALPNKVVRPKSYKATTSLNSMTAGIGSGIGRRGGGGGTVSSKKKSSKSTISAEGADSSGTAAGQTNLRRANPDANFF